MLVVTFLALLELARELLIEITQSECFAPIYVKLGYAQPADVNHSEAKRILEAALLAVARSRSALPELKRLFDDEIAADTLRNLLDELRADWSGRAVELVSLASGWRFQTRPSSSRTSSACPPKSRRATRAR